MRLSKSNWEKHCEAMEENIPYYSVFTKALEKHGMGELDGRSCLYDWENNFVASTFDSREQMIDRLESDDLKQKSEVKGKFPYRIIVKDKPSYLYLLGHCYSGGWSNRVVRAFRTEIADHIRGRPDLEGYCCFLPNLEGFLAYQIYIQDSGSEEKDKKWEMPTYKINVNNLNRLVQDTVHFFRLLNDTWGDFSYRSLERTIGERAYDLTKQLAETSDPAKLIRTLDLAYLLGRR